jgi:hypothetical protein
MSNAEVELTKEQREAKDKADRERETTEQAGKEYFSCHFCFNDHIISALPYQWRQELGEVEISVGVPAGTRAKDLVVTIQKKKLIVGLKSQTPIMSGELCKEIKVEESNWTLRACIRYSALSCSHFSCRGSKDRSDCFRKTE